jgi:hypothetical protein
MKPTSSGITQLFHTVMQFCVISTIHERSAGCILLSCGPEQNTENFNGSGNVDICDPLP